MTSSLESSTMVADLPMLTHGDFDCRASDRAYQFVNLLARFANGSVSAHSGESSTESG